MRRCIGGESGAKSFNLVEAVPNAIDKALEEAELIVVLGFAFHQQNMQLFAPSYTATWRPRPR
jgi:hypothetical protein